MLKTITMPRRHQRGHRQHEPGIAAERAHDARTLIGERTAEQRSRLERGVAGPRHRSWQRLHRGAERSPPRRVVREHVEARARRERAARRRPAAPPPRPRRRPPADRRRARRRPRPRRAAAASRSRAAPKTSARRTAAARRRARAARSRRPCRRRPRAGPRGSVNDSRLFTVAPDVGAPSSRRTSARRRARAPARAGAAAARRCRSPPAPRRRSAGQTRHRDRRQDVLDVVPADEPRARERVALLAPRREPQDRPRRRRAVAPPAARSAPAPEGDHAGRAPARHARRTPDRRRSAPPSRRRPAPRRAAPWRRGTRRSRRAGRDGRR